MANFAETGSKLITESKNLAARHWHRAMVDLGLVIAGASVATVDVERNGLNLDNWTSESLKHDHPTLVGALVVTVATAGVGLNHVRMARLYSRDANEGEATLRANNVQYVDPSAIEATQAFYDSYREPRQ